MLGESTRKFIGTCHTRLDDAICISANGYISSKFHPCASLVLCFQLEEPSDANRNQRISCDVSFRDPEGHLGDISASKKQNYARQVSSANIIANNPGTFHLSMSEQNSEEDARFGRPLIEYTCGDKLQPVPLVRVIDIVGRS